jgi:hypothetical protein
MSDLEYYLRLWPYAFALFAGAAFAVIDRRLVGHYVFGVLLVLTTIGGLLGINFSPFTWQGGTAWFVSIMALLLGFSALAGYALAVVFMWARGREHAS